MGKIPLLPFFFLEVDFFLPLEDEEELLPVVDLLAEPVDAELFFVVPGVGDFLFEVVLWVEDVLPDEDDPFSPLSEVEYF